MGTARYRSTQLLPSEMQAQGTACSNFPPNSRNLDSSVKTPIKKKNILAANSIDLKHVWNKEGTLWGGPELQPPVSAS